MLVFHACELSFGTTYALLALFITDCSFIEQPTIAGPPNTNKKTRHIPRSVSVIGKITYISEIHENLSVYKGTSNVHVYLVL